MGARKASWEQACAGGKPHRERHYNNSVSGRSKAGEVLDLLENEGAGCISQRGIGGALRGETHPPRDDELRGGAVSSPAVRDKVAGWG